MSQPSSVAPLAEPPAPVAGSSPLRPGRRRRPLLALLAAAVVLGLVVVGVQLARDLRHDAAVAAAADATPLAGALPATGPAPGLPPSAVPPPSAVLPPATVPPTGLGGDPALDGEAEGCATGDMVACVELYLSSYRDPALSRYAAYGDTCAGRQPAGTLRLCTASFPR